MKVELLEPMVIGGKQYGKHSVVDLLQPDAEKIVADGAGRFVKDGTMARMKAYGVAGCVPPPGFSAQALPVDKKGAKNKHLKE